MSRKTEIQVGATVLIALAILIWGLAWLKEYSLQRSSRIWHVEFPESGGLSPSDEVQVNGMRKGQVKTMKLMGDHVRIDLSLDKEITLDYVMDHCVIFGSVNKVVDQILALREETGDFGELVYAGMDWVEPALNKRSMQLMAEEVMPRVNAAIGKSAAAA